MSMRLTCLIIGFLCAALPLSFTALAQDIRATQPDVKSLDILPYQDNSTVDSQNPTELILCTSIALAAY
jgi:hypothetical protein